MRVIKVMLISLVIVGQGIAQAQFDATFVPSIFVPDFQWTKWGNDLRNSHHHPAAQGPTNPRLLWFLPGGLIDEPMIDNAAQLWFPTHPYPNNPRYTHYRIVDALGGSLLGTVWPYWGQASTPIILNTAVYVRTSQGDFSDVISDWPVLVLSGGQYDILVYSPNPILGLPPIYWIGAGIPAYRSGLTAYTEGLSGYILIGDNTGLVTPIMVFWVVVEDTGESFPYLYVDVPLNPPDLLGFVPGAVYSIVGASGYSDIVISTHHSGHIICYDMTPLGAPAILWFTSLEALSRVDPQDSSPITSDICDRPAVMSEDNQTVFVCATNYGRVYAIDTLAPAKLWVAELNKPIMAGPAIGPDPNNGNEETLYVVVRNSPSNSALVAIRASDGTVKWQRVLRNVSRCTPTIDANGRLFIGDDRGYLYALNPDGSILWMRYLGAAIRVSPVLARFGDMQPIDVLYVSASNRMLYAFVESNPIRVPGGGTGAGTGSSW